MVGSLSRKAFGKRTNKDTSECVICMEEYKETDDVAELKCDQRHYFHSKCLADWLKQKLECPLCKKPVKL